MQGFFVFFRAVTVATRATRRAKITVATVPAALEVDGGHESRLRLRERGVVRVAHDDRLERAPLGPGVDLDERVHLGVMFKMSFGLGERNKIGLPRPHGGRGRHPKERLVHESGFLGARTPKG